MASPVDQFLGVISEVRELGLVQQRGLATQLAELQYDWSRESGTQLSQYRREREIEALFKPEDFIKERNTAILAAEEEAAQAASDAYRKYIDEYHYPTDLARSIASRVAEANLSIKHAEIEAQFGGKELSQAKERPIVLQQGAGAGGSSTASTA